MITSSSVRSLALSAAAVCVLAVAVGCADNMGDSRRARLEGNQLYNRGQYAEAAGSFQHAVRQDTRDYKARYGLAVSYDAMKAYQQAISAYKTTLDVMNETLDGRSDPAFRVKVIDALGACVARSDERDVETTRLADLANSRQKAEDYLILAKVYAYSGDADSALDAYQRAYLLDKKNFYVNKEYGLYLTQLGQTQRSIDPLQRAYAANQKDEQVNNALRQAGVVPGLSLKDEKDLAEPLIPRGPLPPPQFGNRKPAPAPAPAPAPQPRTSPETVQAPRD